MTQVHCFARFCDLLVELSRSSTTVEAIKKWRFDEEYEVEEEEKCLCGTLIKRVAIYKNIHNKKRIKVGSTCIKHFSEYDGDMKCDSEFFTQNGYEKDGFVVDDVSEGNSEDSEDEESESEDEDSEDEEDVFEFDSVMEVNEEEDVCLVKWKNTEFPIGEGTLSFSNKGLMWRNSGLSESRKNIIQTHEENIKEFKVTNQKLVIVWKNTWEKDISQFLN